jgi:hypothetical protein
MPPAAARPQVVPVVHSGGAGDLERRIAPAILEHHPRPHTRVHLLRERIWSHVGGFRC